MTSTEPGSKPRGAADRAAPTLLWLRRDLRLGDHPALNAAIDRGRPVIPVYIWDPAEEALLGAAARWRLSKSLAALREAIAAIGGRLILRRGEALVTLRALARETDAEAVYWSRYYEPSMIERDRGVKAALGEDGLEARSFGGFLLREPFETQTQAGGCYKVYSPFQRAFAADYTPGEASPAPAVWPAPHAWPDGIELSALALEAPMRRGAAVLERSLRAGEAAAEERLGRFLEDGLARYHDRRDRLDLDGTSGLSQHLAFGEISPRRAWLAASFTAERDPGSERGAGKFLKELIWREFAWHLAYHAPELRIRNWREEWDAFPWRGEAEAGADLQAWRRGRTGVAVVDAAMRELYATGLMHNRARMITASYLTKNLMIDWRLGERWFADCLIDFDPASNGMGWQWVAGSGPDAAPFFRIFNPDTQAEKFDPKGRYRARWLPERAGAAGLALDPPEPAVDGRAFFEACPRAWGLSPEDPPPQPSISLKAGRERALQAYQALKSD